MDDHKKLERRLAESKSCARIIESPARQMVTKANGHTFREWHGQFQDKIEVISGLSHGMKSGDGHIKQNDRMLQEYKEEEKLNEWTRNEQFQKSENEQNQLGWKLFQDLIDDLKLKDGCN